MAGFTESARRAAVLEQAADERRAETLCALDGALTFARRERLSTVLSDDETSALAALAHHGASANTLRATAADLEYLVLWHRARWNRPLAWPPQEEAVLNWLDHERHAMPATLKRRLASWTRIARVMGNDCAVFASSPVRDRLATHPPRRPQSQAPCPGGDELARLLAACPAQTLAGLRDRALLAAVFAWPLGPGDLTALRIEDFRHIRQLHPCLARPCKPPLPVSGVVAQRIVEWLDAAGLKSGPLFRRVDRWERVGKIAMSPQSVKLVIRRYAKQAGLDAGPFTVFRFRRTASADLTQN